MEWLQGDRNQPLFDGTGWRGAGDDTFGEFICSRFLSFYLVSRRVTTHRSFSLPLPKLSDGAEAANDDDNPKISTATHIEEPYKKYEASVGQTERQYQNVPRPANLLLTLSSGNTRRADGITRCWTGLILSLTALRARDSKLHTRGVPLPNLSSVSTNRSSRWRRIRPAVSSWPHLLLFHPVFVALAAVARSAHPHNAYFGKGWLKGDDKKSKMGFTVQNELPLRPPMGDVVGLLGAAEGSIVGCVLQICR